MRKVNSKDIEERERTSPKGRFHKFSKDISIALGREPESLDLPNGIRLTSRWCEFPKGKSFCPYHSHSSETELYLVVSGRGNVRDKEWNHRSWTGRRVLLWAGRSAPAEPPATKILFIT